MSARRDTSVLSGERPLTARSAVASLLLGTVPPWLPTRALVRGAALFGLTEGAVRTALSRMQAAGEVRAERDGYRLDGRLLERQARQEGSRHPGKGGWDGGWRMAVVTAGGPRPAAERAELRQAMAALRLGELREGTWLRPENLTEPGPPSARARADASCTWFTARPQGDPAALAAGLWDLGGWADRSRRLEQALADLLEPLAGGDTTVLADGFVCSAAVLRHLQADPLLPEELLPPGWPGDELRRRYDAFDTAYRAVLLDWLRRR